VTTFPAKSATTKSLAAARGDSTSWRLALNFTDDQLIMLWLATQPQRPQGRAALLASLPCALGRGRCSDAELARALGALVREQGATKWA
jgi:hypothetical protein